MNKLLKQYAGLALMFIGAILLVVCRLTGWQSNPQLLISLSVILLGYFLHIWLQKHGEKY
ncbi:MAG: hypothetical protein IKM76_05750 [Prevotella sp.]|jgi:hypothetical protein|nr:hypothetical protein [Prevotella sp.]